jgi:hypothetical protein
MILLAAFVVPIGWTAILHRTWRQICQGHCFGWAAALAYYSFLALFPALLFVVSVASFLPIQHLIDQFVDMVGRFAPGGALVVLLFRTRDSARRAAERDHRSHIAPSRAETLNVAPDQVFAHASNDWRYATRA